MRIQLSTILRCVLPLLAATASAQRSRPDELGGFTKFTDLKGIQAFDNPRISPDGRWLAFNGGTTEPGTHIWVMPMRGGAPVRITTGEHTDTRPIWVGRGSNRIAFRSDRTGGIMTIEVDPVTMKPRTAPKRATTDSVAQFAFDVTPDGASIVYSVATGDSLREIRVIPTEGGPPQTLAQLRGNVNSVRVDASGTTLYFMQNPGGRGPKGGSPARYIKKVSIAGGPVTTVQTIAPDQLGVAIDPIADRVVVREAERMHVLTLRGDSVARLPFMAGLRTVSSFTFTRDGASIISGTNAQTASLETMPLDGSPLVTLTDSSDKFFPDQIIGKTLFYYGAKNNRIFTTSLDGKERGQVPLAQPLEPDGRLASIRSYMVGADGQWLIYTAVTAKGDSLRYLYDATTKKTKALGRAPDRVRLFGLSGNGDSYFPLLGNEMIYTRWNGGKAEVHAINRQGQSRLLRSYSMTTSERRFLALGPGKIAERFTDATGTHVDVTIGNGRPVRVLSIPKGSMGEMVFSRDGSRLIVEVTEGTGDSAKSRFAFISTATESELRSQPVWVPNPENTYHYAWTPDDKAVIAFGFNDPATRMSIWRIHPVSGSQAELLSRRVTTTFWDYALSSDGKSVVLPLDRNLGTTLWRGDIKSINRK